ncbi:MAG: protein translocase subunit SecD [Chloroflexota bacterium]|nr:MAG: protein translocase subunit SecD [Chloroflexota bacterium]
MKLYRTPLLILVIVLIAVWLVLPNNPGIHFGGIEREISTRLGLDLVGGVQVLLEADLPEGTEIDRDAMDTATKIVDNRVNELGVVEAVVQQAGDRFIVVEIPDVQDPEKAIALVRETALLEFVDMTSVPVAQARALEGTTIATDFGGVLPSETVTPTESITGTATVWHTIMTGAALKTVSVQRNDVGQYLVAFELTPEGAEVFGDFTSQHVGQVLAIALDKTIISAPSINSAITEGQGTIVGSFTQESANDLAIKLRYGSLPIPLKVVETRTIGPTLGQDSLQKSLIAGMVGFAIVILFMGLYYRLPGLVADVAIIVFALILFAMFRFIPVTLTLPGIAGLMLSTGSALDANILIFERLKEELRSGRTLRQAFDLGWQRAWPSIRDSNISTLITCAILFYFGSAFGATLVKGFSLTLALGVGVSLFTAIVVTRSLLNLVLNLVKPTNLEKWFGI